MPKPPNPFPPNTFKWKLFEDTWRGFVDGGGPSNINFSDDEISSGLIDGNNKTFPLSNAPNPPASLQVFYNGVKQEAGAAPLRYSLSSNVVTMVNAPLSGSTLTFSYRY